MSAIIIDELDSGCAITGAGWGTVADASLYNGNCEYGYPDSDTSQTVKWHFTGLVAGNYDVAVTYPANGTRCTATPWKIYDSNGTTVLASGTFDQTQSLNDFSVVDDLSHAIWFEYIPGYPFTVSGTSLTVEINLGAGPGTGTVVADAVWVNAGGGPSVPTTATLSGPTSGTVGVASTNFTITLDQPAEAGGVDCVITDSAGGDTITPA